mmetsp:Transcript_37877/g.33892  ORF Transcript_37877/g.33892 Transcript_37877/m.33892 type:complete len:280 (+) Transcript_37877:478-1317(+)
MVGEVYDIALGEVPMSVSEFSDVVQERQVQQGRFRMRESKVLNTNSSGSVFNPTNILIVAVGTISSEISQDLSQGILGHESSELKEVINGGNDGVIGTRFTSIRHGLITDTLIDDAIGEHGLVLNTQNEGSEVVVVLRLGSDPHGLHLIVDVPNDRQEVGEGINSGSMILILDGLKNTVNTADQLAGVGVHGNVGGDETVLRSSSFKSSDQFQVFVDEWSVFVNSLIIVESIREGVFHERLGSQLLSELPQGDRDVLGELGATMTIRTILQVTHVAGFK